MNEINTNNEPKFVYNDGRNATFMTEREAEIKNRYKVEKWKKVEPVPLPIAMNAFVDSLTDASESIYESNIGILKTFVGVIEAYKGKKLL